jgi:hypothetical protein
MVVIIKLRSEIGCDTFTFTRKYNKISRNMEEEINCETAFGTARRWKYKIGNMNLFTQ